MNSMYFTLYGEIFDGQGVPNECHKNVVANPIKLSRHYLFTPPKGLELALCGNARSP